MKHYKVLESSKKFPRRWESRLKSKRFPFTREVLQKYLLIIALILFMSCKKINESPMGCVVTVLECVERLNPDIVWNNLSEETQKYFNSLGEKQRRSGKGAMEYEIKKIQRLRAVNKDFRLEESKTNPEIIIIKHTNSETIFEIETVKEGKGYKIRNADSFQKLLSAITLEKDVKDGY